MGHSIAFRADASLTLGSGHVMRCLSLADMLAGQGAQTAFVMRDCPGHLHELVRGRGHAVLPLAVDVSDAADATATSEQLAGWAPGGVDWLVVDHYGLDARWERAVRTAASPLATAPRVRRILVIDDLADRPHDCDALLDQNLTAGGAARYDGLLPPSCERLVGPRYALLQPPYAPLHDACKPREGAIRRVLIFFGGADRHGLTLRALQAALQGAPTVDGADLTIDVVLGMASAGHDEVRSAAAPHANVRVHCGLPSLAPLLVEADLAIGAGGATSWERLCVGLPAIVVTVADNQNEVTRLLAGRQLVDWIGDPAAATTAAIGAALQAKLAAGNQPGWFPDYQDLIDGRGVQRVCAALMDQEPLP